MIGAFTKFAMAPCYVIVVWLVLGIRSGFSETNVIYHSGNTRPITVYVVVPNLAFYEELTPTGARFQPIAHWLNQYPIQTPSMSPGAVQSRPVDYPSLPKPLFLIGTDELSRNWLREHRDRLIELDAVGLLIEVTSAEAFREVEQIADGLDLTPVSGSLLGTHLQLKHYPVLISRHRIEQ